MTKGRVYILDIPIDVISFNDLKHKLTLSVQSKTRVFISTVNASFIYKSLSNNDFKELLNSTDINTPDGVSIQLASEYLFLAQTKNLFSFILNFILGVKIGLLFLFGKLKFTYLKTRITGIDLTKFLLNLAEEKKLSLFILNREDGLTSNSEIETYINKNFPHIRLKVVSVKINATYNKDLSSYSIILCTLGEYYQEKLLAKYSQNTDAILVGVGSTFDVLTQKITQVGTLYQQKGLEWLVRLITRPKRFPKIFRSVVLFPLKVYRSTL